MSDIMIQAEITKVINFALQQNRIPVIQQISIINNSAMSLEDVSLHIKCDPDFAVPFVKPIQIIPANQRFIVRDINFILRADFLAALTERITGSLTIELRSNSDIITEISYEIIALAYDEWNGAQCYPELIAAFVMPNHPEVAKINVLASSLLKEWTGDPSLDGYQRKDLNRVKQQAAAVYGAFQKQHIIYSEPPASFETVGQRVRLCDTVIQQHMGTCLDLSLFYAACLEQMGLHPLLILQHGHIFAGVWLEDLTFPEAVQDDSSLITKRLSDDIGEITVVECTACTAGHNADFNAAESTAKHELQGVDSVLYIIDVRRARLSGIRPLPMRINTESGWQINYEEQNSEEQIAAPNRMRKTVPVFEEAETSNSKIIQWEHKLLDLGLRNTLINMRLTRTIVPILSSSLDDLEDALSSGDEFTLLSCPSEWSLLGRSTYNFENVNDLGTYKEIILQEFGNKHLRSIFSDADLKSILVNLYRTAKTNLEENGANTLYLALGILRWYESPLSCKPRYAPLVMLPVDIIRKSNYGYVIHLRDEDPQINITLLEFLKHNFNLVISGLDPLPNDEHGIDVRKTFAIIRHAIMEQPHWDVLESVFLGIFSFTQFVMWNDIRNRLSDLKRNKIVCSLLDGKLSWESESMQIGDSVPEDDTFLPLPADASQLFAICAAMDGESFVLDGPPGTGKSQTITTMIANAIAQGRTVLFVAEKRAALSVVRERLDKLGLTPFCLELHSNKSSKRYVLDQLKTATDITRNIPSSEYQKKAAQATILRENLNKYAVALHKIRLSGISVFDMLNRYEIYDKYISDIELSQEFVRSVRSESLIDFELVLERLLAAGKALGHPHGHPLRYIGVTHYSQLLKTELPKTLKTCKDALTTLISCYKALCQNIGYDYPSTIDEWTRVANIASSLYCWHELPRSWAKEQDIITLVQKVRELICHAKKAESIKTELMKRWMPSFLEQDGNELANRYKVISEKWFLSKAIGLHKIRRHLAIYSKNGINRETLLTDIQTLAQYRDEDHQCADFITMLRDGLEFFYKNKEYPDWEEIDHACFSALQYSEDLKELFGNDELRIQYAALKETNEITRKALNTWQAYLDNFKQLDELISVRSEFVQKDTLISSQVTMCNEIDENLDKLKEWMTFYGIALEAQNIGLKNVVSAYETGLAHDAVLPCFYRSIYKSMVQDIVENDDILNSFSGVVFNENISQFKRIDEELLATTRKEIYYRLAAKIPDFSKEAAHSSELGILQRAIGSGGRGISIRRLFEQIPHLLPRLCPCMLMSPISAAQYLDPKCTPFNIVIFDEASQLPTCKAVGVLARGENAIIVGDQNQMPPTSFFTSNDDFMDNQQDEDLESILRDCLALNMPRTHLQWHYRSRHESLIAFSNRQFYESRLLTFPSINDRESKVKFIPVHGYFDSGKTRQNRAEAKAIIEEIIRRFNDPELNKYSIGVVTFNIQQQTLVQDMLDEKCALNPELKNWIDHAGEYGEELWIKNLETVQGDERDVILFSIAFGPGENGARPSMNFGPLNRDGGWRRLNVAVSRARYEMIIFSSLQPEMIDLSRTSANAKGVKALKAFLEYAKNGLLSVDEYSTNQYVEQERSNGIAESICQALNAADYCTAKSIGKSEYRIDVGVIDPQRPDCYMLGILLDGKSYGHAKTVRDREIEQISVLEGLGWKLYRIWSMDWWDNKQKEIEKLLAYLEDSKKKSTGLIPSQPIVERKATEAVETLQTVVASDYKELEPIIVKPHTIARPYVLTKLLFRKITADDYINNTWENRQRFESVIAIEAPISESLLIHRVLQSYGIARAGRRIQAWSRVILNTVTCQVTKQGNQTFYWRTDQEPAMYIGYRVSIGDGDSRRAAIDVPEEEVANAACEVLEEQIGLPKEDLIKETAKKFGYQRNGPMVAEVMKNGIEYARISGRIRFDDSGYASRKHSF